MSRRGGGNIPNQGVCCLLAFAALALLKETHTGHNIKRPVRVPRGQKVCKVISLHHDSKVCVVLRFSFLRFTKSSVQSTKGYI